MVESGHLSEVWSPFLLRSATQVWYGMQTSLHRWTFLPPAVLSAIDSGKRSRSSGRIVTFRRHGCWWSEVGQGGQLVLCTRQEHAKRMFNMVMVCHGPIRWRRFWDAPAPVVVSSRCHWGCPGGRGAAYSCFEPFSASISGMFRASALAHFPLEVEKGTGVSFIMKGFFSVRGWPSPRKWSQCQFLVCSRTSLHMSRGSNTLLHAISGPFSALHGFHFWMLFCFFVCWCLLYIIHRHCPRYPPPPPPPPPAVPPHFYHPRPHRYSHPHNLGPPSIHHWPPPPPAAAPAAAAAASSSSISISILSSLFEYHPHQIRAMNVAPACKNDVMGGSWQEPTKKIWSAHSL